MHSLALHSALIEVLGLMHSGVQSAQEMMDVFLFLYWRGKMRRGFPLYIVCLLLVSVLVHRFSGLSGSLSQVGLRLVPPEHTSWLLHTGVQPTVGVGSRPLSFLFMFTVWDVMGNTVTPNKHFSKLNVMRVLVRVHVCVRVLNQCSDNNISENKPMHCKSMHSNSHEHYLHTVHG